MIIFQEMVDEADLSATADESTLYSEQTYDWPQNVYYAWVLYGAASYTCAIYWIQKYYFNNWYGDAAEYLSAKPSTFTLFGMGEEINRLMLILMWGLTAIFWSVTFMQNDGLYMFFVMWARILHYADITRIIVSTVFKVLGMAMDTQEDYMIEDGLAMDDGAIYLVSMEQQLSGTDWYMESFGLTVSFSLFGDLLGITKNVDAKEITDSLEEAISTEPAVEDIEEDGELIDAF
jgi:hypothetical protein